MSWMNLARLLAILHRREIDPRDVTVYWDGKIDVGFRRPPPQYTEPATEFDDDQDEED